MSFLRKRRGVVTAGLMSLALLTPQVSAAAPSPAVPAASSTTVAVADDGYSTTSTKTGCFNHGFDWAAQRYRNCSSAGHFILARAHESSSGRWFNYYYCVPSKGSRSPLAVWGQLVWTVTYLRTC